MVNPRCLALLFIVTPSNLRRGLLMLGRKHSRPAPPLASGVPRRNWRFIRISVRI